MDESLIIARDGQAWGGGTFVQLPRHWTIGFLKKLTAWGEVGENTTHKWPTGCWLPGEELKAGRWHQEFDAQGVRFPAHSLIIADHLGQREFPIATGFVVGALLHTLGSKCVYIVLYRRADGRREPRIVEPTAAWLRRQAADAAEAYRRAS